jgi:hypothetical protein
MVGAAGAAPALGGDFSGDGGIARPATLIQTVEMAKKLVRNRIDCNSFAGHDGDCGALSE